MWNQNLSRIKVDLIIWGKNLDLQKREKYLSSTDCFIRKTIIPCLFFLQKLEMCVFWFSWEKKNLLLFFPCWCNLWKKRFFLIFFTIYDDNDYDAGPLTFVK